MKRQQRRLEKKAKNEVYGVATQAKVVGILKLEDQNHQVRMLEDAETLYKKNSQSIRIIWRPFICLGGHHSGNLVRVIKLISKGDRSHPAHFRCL